MNGKGEARQRRARHRRSVRRLGVLCTTVVLAGCPGCSENLEDGTALPLPTVKLVVLPADVYSASGASFTLDVRAFDAAEGRTVPPSSISWTASSQDVTVTASGGRALVNIPATFSGASFEVTATSGTLISSPASVKLAQALGGDDVQLPMTSGAPPMSLVADASDGMCQQDMRWNITGVARLGRNLDAGTCADPQEVALFSTDHGVLFETAPPIVTSGATGGSPGVVPPWTSGGDLLQRNALPPLRDVGISFRIYVHDTLTAQVVADAPIEAITLANAFFGAGRTGIRFSQADMSVGAGPESFNVGDCGNTALLTSLGVDLTQTKLYLVYVQKVASGDARGWTCPRLPTVPGAVMFVDASSKTPTTAAHELGHVMGLSAPLPKDGHSGDSFLPLYGFDYTNLMWGGEDLTQALPRTGLTLGQAFRMNLDRHSWLVHVYASGATPRQCQCDPYVTAVCPVMYLDVLDLDPPPSSLPKLVCKVDPWGP